MYSNFILLEIPKIEKQDEVEEVNGVVGGNITMKCKTSGYPKPDITWLHNGHILNKNRKRSIREDGEWYVSKDGFASLTLTNISEDSSGTYTLLAANKAGVVEKKFHVQILGLLSLF